MCTCALSARRDSRPAQALSLFFLPYRLTAFVLKSFARARSHIFIDEKHIQDALIWLSQNQKENGCFRSSGVLLNNAMKVACLPSSFLVRLALDCKSNGGS